MTMTGMVTGKWLSDTTPAELIHFSQPSSTPQIGAFLDHLVDRVPGTVGVQEIGRSTEDRPIYAAALSGQPSGIDGDTLRIMLYGQQHGGEAAGMEASLMLARDLALGPLHPLLEQLSVWIVPQVNPDGAAVGERRTATGADLNRGHHLLAEPEHRALYGLFHDVKPHLTVDLHEHGVVRDPHFLPDGGIASYDLMAEGPTNLNIGPAIRPLADEALDAMDRGMTRDGFAYRRYIPYSPDGTLALVPRYSNLAIYGGRGQPTIWGCLSFLTEAMRHPDVSARLERRTRSTYSAVAALLSFAAERAGDIRDTVEAERTRLRDRGGQTVILRGEYRRERQDPPLLYAYVNPATGASDIWEIHEAGTTARAVVERRMPDAYWLDLDDKPATRDPVLDLLDGHRVHHERLAAARQAWVEHYLIEQFNAEDWNSTRIVLDRSTESVPAGALLVPTAQTGATLAALLLEPESMNGLALAGRLPTTPDAAFPIKRVIWDLDGSA